MEQLIYILYIFVQGIYVALVAAQILMLLRAICSIFVMDEESRIAKFLYYATEPLIYPLRVLFGKFGAFDDFVLDIPYMATIILIVLIQSALPVVYI